MMNRKEMSMGALVELKSSALDDFQVSFEVVPPVDMSELTVERRKAIIDGLEDTDKQLKLVQDKINELNSEIDKLTCHADEIDYAVGVISGVIAGMIDSFFVGETDIDKDKIQGVLEKKYHTANDSAYKHKDKDGHWTSSAMYHRLDDLAHHPTLGGLVASILVRYFRLVIFVDGSDGKPHVFFADTSSSDMLALEKKQLQMAWVGAIISGICLWLASMAEKKYEDINGEEMPEPLRKIVKAVGATPMIIEILKTADIWIGHMMSDVSTSQGIPSVFLSLLKEISVLPGLRKTNLPVVVDSLYNKGENNLSEWGGVVFTAAKKQMMPVLINEALVRGFYFVRHLISEYKECGDWKKLDWGKTIPFGNRTVERMITISSGAFMAIDLADAAIRSATNPTSASVPTFLANMVLRVNFANVGRFAIAIVTDVGMGIKKCRTEKERRELLGEMLRLTNTRVYYREADVMCSYAELHEDEARMHGAEADLWKEVGYTQDAMEELYLQVQNTGKVYWKTIEGIDDCFDELTELLPDVEKTNPGLLDEILRRL